MIPKESLIDIYRSIPCLIPSSGITCANCSKNPYCSVSFACRNALKEIIQNEQESRLMTKELVADLIEGVTVWVEQRTETRSFLVPMISDGKGNIGCFSLSISVKDVDSPDYRYWSGRPTDEQRKAVKWE